uniref:hypothetical protein n=1 Tax=Carnobacterium sp. TaxID=48221 RepID=UPI001597BD0C|nr:hypothetical protein [Carnobacterium sp.]QJS06093.1 hypothetical protein [Carnobacterium sp.]
MNDYFFELLFIKKNSGKSIETTFNELLSSYVHGVHEKRIQYEDNGKLYLYEYTLTPIKDSLIFFIKYLPENKEDISTIEMSIFKKLIVEIQIKASKNNLSNSTLFENISLYFIKKIIPYVNKYEWSLRRFTYLILNENLGKNWPQENLPNETNESLKGKMKGGNKDRSNILQELTLGQLEYFLFEKNHLRVESTLDENENAVVTIDRIEIHDFIHLMSGSVKKFVSEPFSLWEEFFKDYIDIDTKKLKEDMLTIRNGRNAVGHNKEISELLYNNLKNLLKKYIDIFDSIYKLILTGQIKGQELEVPADEFDDYINYINSNVFKSINALSNSFTQNPQFKINAELIKTTSQSLAQFQHASLNPNVLKSISALSNSFTQNPQFKINAELIKTTSQSLAQFQHASLNPNVLKSISALSNSFTQNPQFKINAELIKTTSQSLAQFQHASLNPNVLKSISALSNSFTQNPQTNKSLVKVEAIDSVIKTLNLLIQKKEEFE